MFCKWDVAFYSSISSRICDFYSSTSSRIWDFYSSTSSCICDFYSSTISHICSFYSSTSSCICDFLVYLLHKRDLVITSLRSFFILNILWLKRIFSSKGHNNLKCSWKCHKTLQTNYQCFWDFEKDFTMC